MTLSSCGSLSGFPYDSIAFRRYRHFALVRIEDLSGIFSTPGASDSLTIQGNVTARNNTICDFAKDKVDMHMHALYFNKKFTITRVSSAIESVTVDKAVAGGIRNGRMG